MKQNKPSARGGAHKTAGGPDAHRPWHHLPGGRFRNPAGSPVRSQAPVKCTLPFFARMVRQSFDTVEVPDGHVIPRPLAHRALSDHMVKQGDFLTWLGHASFLMRLNGKVILTDPYLTRYAGPAGLGPKRYVKSGIAIGDLPPVDYLVVSHNHYDHLDERALARLPGKDRMTVIVPLRLGEFFTARGFKNVVELDWHDAFEGEGVKITALPVVHWSRRSGFDTNRTLWAGFSFKAERHHVFFGGDSAYGPVFEEIGKAYGPFDTALIGIGAYEPRVMMAASHANPEEAVAIGRDIGAKRLVGMHWGTVVLTAEPPFEPPERFMKAGRESGYTNHDLWIMAIGETRDLSDPWPANT